MPQHIIDIGDQIQAVPDGEYFTRAGVITEIDWDNPRNPHPVSVSFRQTPSCPAVRGEFAFAEINP